MGENLVAKEKVGPTRPRALPALNPSTTTNLDTKTRKTPPTLRVAKNVVVTSPALDPTNVVSASPTKSRKMKTNKRKRKTKRKNEKRENNNNNNNHYYNGTWKRVSLQNQELFFDQQETPLLRMK